MLITEAILTTLDDHDAPHHAPFGFVTEGDFIRIAPFRPSRSLDLLLRRKLTVLNITDDPRFFAACITKRQKDFATVKEGAGVGLKEACARWQLKLHHVEDDTTRPHLYFEKISASAGIPWQGYNRGRGAIIEACVLLSRLHLLPPDEIKADFARLAAIVARTAGDAEEESWQWLVEHYDAWRKKKEEAS